MSEYSFFFAYLFSIIVMPFSFKWQILQSNKLQFLNQFISANKFPTIDIFYASTTIQWMKVNNKVSLVEWCPTGFKIRLNDVPAAILEQDDIGACSKNAVMIANNTGISRMFYERILHKCDLLHSTRSFLHWYYGQGIGSRDYCEASKDLRYLENDYSNVLIEKSFEDDDLYINDDTNYY
ncbi:alpha-1 tubulin [Reticulomyxa filosa]|uniref:Alpha-1 tubulin n=1 Tax=Reticulomyxa filosa TaxID=46433 RepID=X6P9T1_RETFI|nr:alpha-1 tubulin [Reticulomyxa filosa]|eukprot:ETO34926.1 alpha-1 tubulin [Reticulomyxa filosa]